MLAFVSRHRIVVPKGRRSPRCSHHQLAVPQLRRSMLPCLFVSCHAAHPPIVPALLVPHVADQDAYVCVNAAPPAATVRAIVGQPCKCGLSIPNSSHPSPRSIEPWRSGSVVPFRWQGRVANLGPFPLNSDRKVVTGRKARSCRDQIAHTKQN